MVNETKKKRKTFICDCIYNVREERGVFHINNVDIYGALLYYNPMDRYTQLTQTHAYTLDKTIKNWCDGGVISCNLYI